MSRRPVNPSRRPNDGSNIPFVGLAQSKSRSSPLISLGLLIAAAILATGYIYRGSVPGSLHDNLTFSSKTEGGVSCTPDVKRAIPVLSKVYGGRARNVLHVGPDSCSVVSRLLKDRNTEAWGVEPFDLDNAKGKCKKLVRKGLVRVADIKFPLPYRAESFSLVIVSDALDYLSPKYLNKTVPELARVAADGLVIFAGYPGQNRAKLAELSKFGRPAKLRSTSWWIRYFYKNSLEENEEVAKKFEQVAVKKSYKPACQVFHIKPSH